MLFRMYQSVSRSNFFSYEDNHSNDGNAQPVKFKQKKIDKDGAIIIWLRCKDQG